MKTSLFFTTILSLCTISLLQPHFALALDSTDIQQLINALPEAGGTITLPAGEHLLTTPNGSLEHFPDGTPIQTAILINKDNVTFQGSQGGTTLKLAPHVKMRVISISSSDVTIKNLIIDGNKESRDGTVPYPGGDVVDGLIYGGQTASNLVFTNLEIKNGIEDALGSWLGHNITVQDNYNHDNGTSQAGGAGLSLSGVTHGTATNNRLENNTATGIWSAFNASNITISNNVIRNNASGGITIGGGSTFNGLGPNNNQFEISDNLLSDNGSAGFASITIYASSDGVLNHNIIESSYFDNIQVGGTETIHSNNWLINNNICSGPVGIKNLGNTNNITVNNNTCQTNFPEILPGDLNHDGHVDLFDYNLLVANFGNPYTLFDYNQLVTNFDKVNL